jgi:hypothetical protein
VLIKKGSAHKKRREESKGAKTKHAMDRRHYTDKLNEVLRPFDVCVKAPVHPQFADALNKGALNFVAQLHKLFETRRQNLLQRRIEREQRIASGLFLIKQTLENFVFF